MYTYIHNTHAYLISANNLDLVNITKWQFSKSQMILGKMGNRILTLVYVLNCWWINPNWNEFASARVYIFVIEQESEHITKWKWTRKWFLLKKKNDTQLIRRRIIRVCSLPNDFLKCQKYWRALKMDFSSAQMKIRSPSMKLSLSVKCYSKNRGAG